MNFHRASLLILSALLSATAWANETGASAVPSRLIARGALSGYRLRAEANESGHGPRFLGPAQEHEFLVIDNAAAWESFWQAHYGAPAGVAGAAEPKSQASIAREAPKVDFSKEFVLALFAGRRTLSLTEIRELQGEVEGGRNGAGAQHGIVLRAVKRDGHGDVKVFYTDHSKSLKAPGAHEASAPANPFHFVAISRVTGSVEFSDAELHHVEPATTLIFGLILAAMILTLALEETIHAKKSLITGVFAVASLFLGDFFGILPLGPLSNPSGEYLSIPIYITAVDWEVIAIILASSIFVDVTSQSGIFTWIAIKLTKQSGGDPLRLLIFYGLMTVAFSAVLNNVTAMIIVGSLTGVSLRKLNRTDLLMGFLLIEGLLTNVGGLLTLISSVPNIIVGSTAGISFGHFFVAAAPYVILSTTLTLLLGARRYKIAGLASEEERAAGAKQVAGFDENDGIESPAFFKISAVMFGLFILVLASTSAIPVLRDLKMGFVAMVFAAIMLVFYKHEVDRFYAKVDWDLIGFFAALFVVINVMEHALVLHAIGAVIAKLLALGQTGGSAALLFASAAANSVTDNIPLAAMLAKILSSQGLPDDSPFWWSVIFGANLGGNLTPIGSASTVVACTIMAKDEVKLSFLGFVMAALLFAGVQIALAIVYVLLLHYIGALWALSLLVLGGAVYALRAP